MAIHCSGVHGNIKYIFVEPTESCAATKEVL